MTFNEGTENFDVKYEKFDNQCKTIAIIKTYIELYKLKEHKDIDIPEEKKQLKNIF